MAENAPPITIVAHDVSRWGGMERQLRELITGLLASGDAVTVVATDRPFTTHPRLRWVRVHAPARPFPIRYMYFFMIGTLVVARCRRGIVHSTGAIILNRVDMATVHLCHHAVAKEPGLVRSERNTPAYRVNARLSQALSLLAEKICYSARRTSLLVGVSQGVAQEIRTHFPAMSDRVCVVPNGVDARAFRPDIQARQRLRSGLNIPKSELVALFVGGEWARKGLRTAVDAVRQTEDWSLLVVGRGDRSPYERFGAREARIRFVDATADVSKFYAAADAFLLPSRYETFSLVTYEAASSGLPLLVTPVSGVTELLECGINGWFINSDAARIARLLERLGRDEKLRCSMGAAARKAAESHSWSAMVDEYRVLYAQLSNRGMHAPFTTDCADS